MDRIFDMKDDAKTELAMGTASRGNADHRGSERGLPKVKAGAKTGMGFIFPKVKRSAKSGMGFFPRFPANRKG